MLTRAKNRQRELQILQARVTDFSFPSSLIGESKKEKRYVKKISGIKINTKRTLQKEPETPTGKWRPARSLKSQNSTAEGALEVKHRNVEANSRRVRENIKALERVDEDERYLFDELQHYIGSALTST